MVMFKKGQLARVKDTGLIVQVVGKPLNIESEFKGFLPVKTVTGLGIAYCKPSDLILIGNNFKFKGAK